ncbi:hypothetical protein M976_02700 [Buttiauxella ferragutiae ATCC 51602]|uniref:Phage protein n=1 Tax=Buttiauxella ferragutiae ATCC 51602 TaxID=1354252 RepID=A0ABX2W6L1_9ENTR|nr:hypothetical protein [Buttiauxella ferragutiae]OAT26539.1 hypothetical protein M976_02700 [Buttiauxella ferragutiae ATCC 51602]
MRSLWAPLALLVAVFLAGWKAHGWHDATVTLAANDTAEETRQLFKEQMRASGEMLETKLGELKANEIHTETVIRTETIKPVFSHVCASDEYVRLFNESADQAERALSGKSVNPLSGQPAPPGR